MSENPGFKQNGDLHAALSDPATRTLNASQLEGRWLNTDPATTGIAEIVIEHDGEGFMVRATGVGADGPIVWPQTKAEVFANLEEEAGQRAVALGVTFDFDFMRAETYLRVNKGVLVIVLFNTFSDESGRSNYITREFYYREN
jgi:hypothetical protein